MNIMKKFTFQFLKRNKKRTIGTIIGIALSTALIYTVGGMFANFRATMIQGCIKNSGYYHIMVGGCSPEEYEELKHNVDIKSLMEYEELQKTRGISDEEIKRDLEWHEKNDYVPEELIEEKKNKKDLYVALKNPKDYESFVESLYQEMGINGDRIGYNRDLLLFEGFALSDRSIKTMIMIVSVVLIIIVVSSVFCIRNSFEISVMEKKKMYGMLSSIGATKSQIKKSVRIEGAILGLFGIPLGIGIGNLAVYILVQILNLIQKNYMTGAETLFVFVISWAAIFVSILLPIITIILSSARAARIAGKTTPIENLRMSKDIKAGKNEYRTPVIIRKIFGMGGVIAYKNLKRSKKKYRTTVISLTISIMVFLGMYSFISEGFRLVDAEYDTEIPDLIVTANTDDPETINALNSILGKEKTTAIYQMAPDSDGEYDQFRVGNEHLTDEARNYSGEDMMVEVVGLEDKIYNEYAKSCGLDENELKGKGILVDYFYFPQEEGGRKEGRFYDLQKGDSISNKNTSIEIGAVEKKTHPSFGYVGGGSIIVNISDFKDVLNMELSQIQVKTNDPDGLEDKIKESVPYVYVHNYSRNAKSLQGLMIIVSIFFYGFITVITLIGVTNIFNTITSNIELRQSEFATLRSVGMTNREFNRMVNLETVFYSVKSLLYGGILGTIASYLMYRSFARRLDMGYYFPWKGLLICVIFVFTIVFIIMRYSVSRIASQNIITTTRNENI